MLFIDGQYNMIFHVSNDVWMYCRVHVMRSMFRDVLIHTILIIPIYTAVTFMKLQTAWNVRVCLQPPYSMLVS